MWPCLPREDEPCRGELRRLPKYQLTPQPAFKQARGWERRAQDGKRCSASSASDASRRVVAHGQQIHGGIGFTKEYKVQLYFRRQKWMELMWGDADHHREKVAQLMGV